MANIKRCDICKAPYEPYNTKKNTKQPNGFRFLTGWARIDCCPQCMFSIQNHIELLRKKEE